MVVYMKLRKVFTALSLLLFIGVGVFALTIDDGTDKSEADGNLLLIGDFNFLMPEPIPLSMPPNNSPVFSVYDETPFEEELSLIRLSSAVFIEPAAAAVELPQPGYINVSGGVRLRAESNTDSAILDTLRLGTALTVTGFAGAEDDWVAVTYGSLNGFILGIYVSFGEQEAPAAVQQPAAAPVAAVTNLASSSEKKDGYINISGGVRLRAESNTSSAILDTLRLGTALTVTGTAGADGDWFAVTHQGRTGYILGIYVSLGTYQAPPAPAPVASIIPAPAPVVNEPWVLEDGETSPGYINIGSGVRLRAESNTESDILDTLRKGTALLVTGVEGDWAAVTYRGMDGFVLAEYVSLGEYVRVVELVDWWQEGKAMMKPGTTATVTDVATGISFNIRVMSVRNHADVEPITSDDAAKILRIRGGQYNMKPRAAILSVHGRSIAVSVNGKPHGIKTIRGNNFNGHFCLHFLNSRNHYNNKVDPGHQAQIQIAYNS
jgi:uncharacterized protein YgiM (DUF1202 family)